MADMLRPLFFLLAYGRTDGPMLAVLKHVNDKTRLHVCNISKYVRRLKRAEFKQFPDYKKKKT